MGVDKFQLNYKCDCYRPEKNCNCSDKVLSGEIHVERVKTVAEALVDIMVECGIPLYKAKRTPRIIQFHFLNFYEVRHRIDVVPHKRLYRLDVFRDLSTRALMNRFESQMAYGIIKRSFRAFYYGTGTGGIPNDKILKGKVHSEQCLWVHAAQRLARLYNSYVGVLPIYQKYIELTLKRNFHRLHDTLATMRKGKQKGGECTCVKCTHRAMMEQTPASDYKQQSDIEISKKTENVNLKKFQLTVTEILERRAAEYNSPSCNCQTFKWSRLDHVIHKEADKTNTGYGQGPFRCSWFIAHKEEIEEDQKPLQANLPEEYPCSLDKSMSNIDLEVECSSCDCNCEYCECESESDLGEIEEMDEEMVFEDLQEFNEMPNNSSFTFMTKCGLATATSSTNTEKSSPCQMQKKNKPIRVRKRRKRIQNSSKIKETKSDQISNYSTE